MSAQGHLDESWLGIVDHILVDTLHFYTSITGHFRTLYKWHWIHGLHGFMDFIGHWRLIGLNFSIFNFADLAVRNTTSKGIRTLPRIIYIRFYTKLAVLLPWIKNHNTEFEIRKLMVETFGHLYGNNQVFIDGATNKSALFWKERRSISTPFCLEWLEFCDHFCDTEWYISKRRR